MRTVSSTVEAADVDEETAGQITDLVEAAPVLRETSTTGPEGQTDSAVRLRPYTDPGGTRRWAVHNFSPNDSELSDFPDPAAAGTHYEKTVRDLASCSSHDEAPWWQNSDVDGIALSACTLTVEYRRNGTWSHDGPHGGENPMVLGRKLLDSDSYAHRLEDAAPAALGILAHRQREANDLAALCAAAGINGSTLYDALARVADAVRVTVTGTTAAGGQVHAGQEIFPPAHRPTPEEITAFTADLQRQLRDDEGPETY